MKSKQAELVGQWAFLTVESQKERAHQKKIFEEENYYKRGSRRKTTVRTLRHT
jgi:hypothetical protein